MSYANYGSNSYDMNESAKRQAEAQRQAIEQQRIQEERQAYERARQAFQEQVIAQEQGRRNAESQANIANSKYELQQKYKQDPHALLKQQALLQTGNEPAMAMAEVMGGMVGNRNSTPSVGLYDHSGKRIGGSYPPPGQGNQAGYGRGGMSPIRQSLLGS